MGIFNVGMGITYGKERYVYIYIEREREVKGRYMLSNINRRQRSRHVPELQTASVQSAKPTVEYDSNGQSHHHVLRNIDY